MLTIMLLSHTSDGAVGATWPRHDVDAELYWSQCCQVMLAMALRGNLTTARYRCQVILATMLPSHPGDGTAT
jgi:hypothetical protein